MTDAKISKESEMLLADVFENIVPEKYYAAAVTKLVEIYGNDVLKGVELDVDFDDTPGIASPTGDPESAEQETVGQASSKAEKSENEASPSNQDSKRKENHPEEL